jgi:hypothetical protein
MDFETKPTADPLQPPPGIIYGTGLRGTIILIHFKYYILIVIWQRLFYGYCPHSMLNNHRLRKQLLPTKFIDY